MIPKWLQRIRHSRGYGVHSPFAFNLITGIINDKNAYYAFFDIEDMLFAKGLELGNEKLHHLSYRLLTHLNPHNSLEIGSTDDSNVFFIASALQDKACYSIEGKETVNERKRQIINEQYHNIQIINKPDKEEKYGSIFVTPQVTSITPAELLSVSGENCFWIVSGIKSGIGKQFWRKTVIDKQAKVTFDMEDIGIIFINNELSKHHYFI